MKPSGSLASEKAALRAHFNAIRQGLSEEEALARSVAICARLAELPELEQAGTVHIYWPLVARREVDTRPLIRAYHEAGRRVVLPVVDSFGGAPSLRHVAFRGEAALRPNRWGILEPEGPSVDLAEVEVIVVPAFGAGRNGHRVGHGRGFYDSFLTGLTVPKLGAVYDSCMVDHVPAEPHDVALDAIVTETNCLRLRP